MRYFLCAGALLLTGMLVGLLASRNDSNEEVIVVREPTESEIIDFLEKQEVDYLRDYDEIARKALEGDVESTWKMYNRYTFAERDYERSYFWAVLLERQGYDPKQKGEYIAGAEGNIEAKFWSRTRDPDRGKGSGSGVLPDLE